MVLPQESCSASRRTVFVNICQQLCRQPARWFCLTPSDDSHLSFRTFLKLDQDMIEKLYVELGWMLITSQVVDGNRVRIFQLS